MEKFHFTDVVMQQQQQDHLVALIEDFKKYKKTRDKNQINSDQFNQPSTTAHKE